ncbi:hypothetical protein AB1K62_14375 [Parasphingorhabdus sp. JC815]|uniref:hypothetical protein n=1 Tax=Parasphingorhabdus sp. JC815 TaxID=3232140 RepID=UPI003459747B
MTGYSIAREVAAAFDEVAKEVGDGSFVLTLIQPATQPQNPWDPPAGEPTETSLSGIVQNYPLGLIDGTLIRSEDRKVMLDATGPRPAVSDKLRIGGIEYAFISIREEAPSGVPVYYECQCRA